MALTGAVAWTSSNQGASSLPRNWEWKKKALARRREEVRESTERYDEIIILIMETRDLGCDGCTPMQSVTERAMSGLWNLSRCSVLMFLSSRKRTDTSTVTSAHCFRFQHSPRISRVSCRSAALGDDHGDLRSRQRGIRNRHTHRDGERDKKASPVEEAPPEWPSHTIMTGNLDSVVQWSRPLWDEFLCLCDPQPAPS